MAKRQSATSLELSPDEERRVRMRKYTIAMSVRMVCIVAGVFTTGILMWIFFALAIFLPYFAVIIANSQGGTTKDNSTKIVAPAVSIPASKIRIVDEE
jgi:predicted tellurium resistance membrane protein TerC